MKGHYSVSVSLVVKATLCVLELILLAFLWQIPDLLNPFHLSREDLSPDDIDSPITLRSHVHKSHSLTFKGREGRRLSWVCVLAGLSVHGERDGAEKEWFHSWCVSACVCVCPASMHSMLPEPCVCVCVVDWRERRKEGQWVKDVLMLCDSPRQPITSSRLWPPSLQQRGPAQTHTHMHTYTPQAYNVSVTSDSANQRWKRWCERASTRACTHEPVRLRCEGCVLFKYVEVQ